MQLVSVSIDDHGRIEQMAALLVAGFRRTAPDSWLTRDQGLTTVQRVLTDGFCRAALDDTGAVVGWIGGLRQYDGNVWELHPLVVDPAQQERGIGRALVLDFEDQVRMRGGLTILLGADDETNLTTLSGVDLYADLPAQLASAQGIRPHPLEFYRQLGYTLVGVIPDANGVGKPDLLLAKRVLIKRRMLYPATDNLKHQMVSSSASTSDGVLARS